MSAMTDRMYWQWVARNKALQGVGGRGKGGGGHAPKKQLKSPDLTAGGMGGVPPMGTLPTPSPADSRVALAGESTGLSARPDKQNSVLSKP